MASKTNGNGNDFLPQSSQRTQRTATAKSLLQQRQRIVQGHRDGKARLSIVTARIVSSYRYPCSGVALRAMPARYRCLYSCRCRSTRVIRGNPWLMPLPFSVFLPFAVCRNKIFAVAVSVLCDLCVLCGKSRCRCCCLLPLFYVAHEFH